MNMSRNILLEEEDPRIFDNDSYSKMSSNQTHRTLQGGLQSLPRDMVFTSESLIAVICYSILLVIGAAGNLTVFVTLFRARQRRSRVNRFIMHLSLADMIVVFIMMPLEIGWHLTVSWEAGDVACRILMFFRALGFYLSSFILIVISLDRVFTVFRPMKPQDAERRGKIMLAMAWLMSCAASAPQVSNQFRTGEEQLNALQSNKSARRQGCDICPNI